MIGDRPNVRIERLDATDVRALRRSIPGDAWSLVANLPYNVSVPLVTDVLERIDAIDRLVVMVQREVADRFVAGAGAPAYGPVSIRVAYHADAAVVRRVPREVFWPRPTVDSTIVRLERRAASPFDVDRDALFRLVDVAFAERRKTIASAIRRLGLPVEVAVDAGVPPTARAQDIDLGGFARLADAALARGWAP